jgi:catalase
LSKRANIIVHSGEQIRDHLVDIIVDSQGKVDKPIRQRMIENLPLADFEFGRRVSKGLKA